MKFVKNIIFMLMEKNQNKNFSIVEIMELTGLSRSSIISALKDLIWEGRVSVSETERPHAPGKKLNMYRWIKKNPELNTCSIQVKNKGN
jgi:DNA-binding transcriptional regulator GbsR (MarR family)